MLGNKQQNAQTSVVETIRNVSTKASSTLKYETSVSIIINHAHFYFLYWLEIDLCHRSERKPAWQHLRHRPILAWFFQYNRDQIMHTAHNNVFFTLILVKHLLTRYG